MKNKESNINQEMKYSDEKIERIVLNINKHNDKLYELIDKASITYPYLRFAMYDIDYQIIESISNNPNHNKNYIIGGFKDPDFINTMDEMEVTYNKLITLIESGIKTYPYLEFCLNIDYDGLNNLKDIMKYIKFYINKKN